jgi:hypothetical protein
MTTVEHKKRRREVAPLVYWADADQIKVRDADNALNLSGIKRIPPSARRAKGLDLVGGYLDALANSNPKAGNGNTSPHIVFANCGGDAVDAQESRIRQNYAMMSKEERARAQTTLDTLIRAWDSALKQYVKRYGPVLRLST